MNLISNFLNAYELNSNSSFEFNRWGKKLTLLSDTKISKDITQ
jgi:hypothetical protein